MVFRICKKEQLCVQRYITSNGQEYMEFEEIQRNELSGNIRTGQEGSVVKNDIVPWVWFPGPLLGNSCNQLLVLSNSVFSSGFTGPDTLFWSRGINTTLTCPQPCTNTLCPYPHTYKHVIKCFKKLVDHTRR